MTSITVTAPAKVNLFLKVLSKRKDSYHNIVTLFERISLADTIKISKIPKGILIKSDKFLTKDPKDNLVYKAAEEILKRGKVRTGVRIEIRKKIPIAAGLGGGSSDAAATLMGINKLFNLRWNRAILMSLGKAIGADVSFFILDTPFALGKGIGDNLRIIDTKTRLWHLLIYPGFKVSTKDIYKAFDGLAGPGLKRLTLRPFDKNSGSNPEPSRRIRRCSGSSTELLPRCLTYAGRNVKMIFPLTLRQAQGQSLAFAEGLTDYEDAESMFYNDLGHACVLKKGIIGNILESLAQLLGKKFIISGSGPSLFCLYRTRKEAIAAKRAILRSVPAKKRQGWQVFVVQTS